MHHRILQRIGLLGLAVALVSCGGDATGPGKLPPSKRVPEHLSVASGDAQAATVGTKLPDQLVVKVTDKSAQPVANATVTWSVTGGGGTLSAASSSTDAQGLAQVEWTLGTQAGENTATAKVGSLTPTTFTATGNAGAPAKIEKVKGDEQAGTAGAVLADSLVVRVLDEHGNGVPGASVKWTVTAGGGSIGPASATTDGEGTARASWTPGTTAGTGSAAATVEGLPAAVFGATTRAAAASRLAKVSGDAQSAIAGATLAQPLAVKVTDAYGNPIFGVSVAWKVTKGGGSVSPATATSDSAGIARGTWKLGTVPGANVATATAAGATLSFTATGTSVPVATVAVSPGTATVQVGAEVDLAAVARDAGGTALTGRTVTWSTSDAGIAAVSSTGVVTGKEAGAATITATVEGKKGTAAITVTAVPVASVAVTPATATISVGGTVDLDAVAKDATGKVLTGRAIAWSTSDAAKATVSSTGVVTGVAGGTATITATVEGKKATASVTVASTTDTSAPDLTDFSFSPVSVDVRTADALLRGSISVTDAGSGALFVQIEFLSPSGTQNVFCTSLEPTTGTTADGTWECEATLPKLSEGGTWHVRKVTITDKLHNSRILTEAQLQALGYDTELTVVSGAADTTAPSLTGFSFSPTSVDVRTADALLRGSVSASDAGSGVENVLIRFTSPDGTQSVNCSTFDVATGTAANGTWDCEVTLPKLSQGGTWHVEQLTVTDKLHHTASFTEAQLQALGYGTELTVTSGASDTTAPNLTGFSFSPSTANVAAGDVIVLSSISATDAGSGVGSVQVRFISPSGAQNLNCLAFDVTTGTTANGTWECKATLPKLSESGTWHVEQLTVTDRISNSRSFTEAQLQALGYDTGLTVTK